MGDFPAGQFGSCQQISSAIIAGSGTCAPPMIECLGLTLRARSLQDSTNAMSSVHRRGSAPHCPAKVLCFTTHLQPQIFDRIRDVNSWLSVEDGWGSACWNSLMAATPPTKAMPSDARTKEPTSAKGPTCGLSSNPRHRKCCVVRLPGSSPPESRQKNAKHSSHGKTS